MVPLKNPALAGFFMPKICKIDDLQPKPFTEFRKNKLINEGEIKPMAAETHPIITTIIDEFIVVSTYFAMNSATTKPRIKPNIP
ncbi:hypothetical protein KTH71_11515 [Acinetobacter sp. WU_MDCI_Axc73]|nr:hypothetical protein [Acinetobacter sp. WU_MDCI_Axc73]